MADKTGGRSDLPSRVECVGCHELRPVGEMECGQCLGCRSSVPAEATGTRRPCRYCGKSLARSSREYHETKACKRRPHPQGNVAENLTLRRQSAVHRKPSVPALAARQAAEVVRGNAGRILTVGDAQREIEGIIRDCQTALHVLAMAEAMAAGRAS